MKTVLHKLHAAQPVNSVNLSKEKGQSSVGAIRSVQSHAGWGLEHLIYWKMSLSTAEGVGLDDLCRSNPNHSTIPRFYSN